MFAEVSTSVNVDKVISAIAEQFDAPEPQLQRAEKLPTLENMATFTDLNGAASNSEEGAISVGKTATADENTSENVLDIGFPVENNSSEDPEQPPTSENTASFADINNAEDEAVSVCKTDDAISISKTLTAMESTLEDELNIGIPVEDNPAENPEQPPTLENMATSTDANNAVSNFEEDTNSVSKTATEVKNISKDVLNIGIPVEDDSPEENSIYDESTIPFTKDEFLDESSDVINAEDVINELIDLSNSGQDQVAFENGNVIIDKKEVKPIIGLENDNLVNSTSVKNSNNVTNEPTKSLQTESVKLNFDDVIDDMLEINKTTSQSEILEAQEAAITKSTADISIEKHPAVSSGQNSVISTSVDGSSFDNFSDSKSELTQARGHGVIPRKAENNKSESDRKDIKEIREQRKTAPPSINGMYCSKLLFLIEFCLLNSFFLPGSLPGKATCYFAWSHPFRFQDPNAIALQLSLLLIPFA